MGGDAKPRWQPLDTVRGLAVAMMILVTSPGDWNQAYAPLRHADWNGWTLTDMVFPTFLFSVGVALALSFPRALDAPGEQRTLWLRAAKRALWLIVIGIALNALMEFKDGLWNHDPGAGTLAHVRIPGVLQRIALCYLIALALILWTARREPDGRRDVSAVPLALAGAALLIAYWALVTFVPVPGYGAGHLEIAGSLPGTIDMAVFSPQHMWRLGSEKWQGPVTYDPEGLLSTMTAAVNVLAGVIAGHEFRRRPDRAVMHVAIAGVVLFVAGLALDGVFPINKRLWTSSFALLSCGFSAMLLAAVVVALRSRVVQRAVAPIDVLGGNAILGFTLSILLGIFAGLPFIPKDGGWTDPQHWGNSIALSLIGEPHLASLACALAIVALVTLAIWPLHRRGIHLRL